MSINHEVGMRIKHTRRKLGLSQADLAFYANYSARKMCHIESGKQNITVFQLLEIAQALDVSVTSLLFGDGS